MGRCEIFWSCIYRWILLDLSNLVGINDQNNFRAQFSRLRIRISLDKQLTCKKLFKKKSEFKKKNWFTELKGHDEWPEKCPTSATQWVFDRNLSIKLSFMFCLAANAIINLGGQRALLPNRADERTMHLSIKLSLTQLIASENFDDPKRRRFSP